MQGPAQNPDRVRRRPPRDRHDPDGARPRPRLLRRGRQPDQRRAGVGCAVLHALGHAPLRPDLLPPDRDRRVPRAQPPDDWRVKLVSADARSLADRARADGPSLLRLSIQRRLPLHDADHLLGAPLLHYRPPPPPASSPPARPSLPPPTSP